MLELHESLEVDHFNMEKEKPKCFRAVGKKKYLKTSGKKALPLEPQLIQQNTRASALVKACR